MQEMEADRVYMVTALMEKTRETGAREEEGASEAHGMVVFQARDEGVQASKIWRNRQRQRLAGQVLTPREPTWSISGWRTL
jgi:hypothetical protein